MNAFFAKPTSLRSYGIPTLLASTTVANTTAGCGSQWTSSMARTPAPALFPQVLQDGTTVTLDCWVDGDSRPSSGRESSTWFRLSNGAFVNSVYMNVYGPWPPAC